MAAGLGGVGGDLPRTRVPERDPLGLRAAAALLLVTAFAFSFGPLGGRIGDGFRAHAALDVIPPRIDAWVTPPAYTGKAPVFLTADANAEPRRPSPCRRAASLSLRVTGGSGEETLAFTDSAGTLREIAPAGPAADGSAKPAPAATGPAAVRQFCGQAHGRRRAVAEIGRGGADAAGRSR